MAPRTTFLRPSFSLGWGTNLSGLSAPADITSLAYLGIAFGTLMLWDKWAFWQSKIRRDL